MSTLALTATVGCASDTADVPDPATSPVTAVETTALTHLERLEGLYQDRERLLSADGEAYAAAWNMTLHRAKEHVAELIGFHVGAYLGRKLSEEMPHDLAEFRAHVADIIATYAGVTVQEVKADMAAIEPGGRVSVPERGIMDGHLDWVGDGLSQPCPGQPGMMGSQDHTQGNS